MTAGRLCYVVATVFFVVAAIPIPTQPVNLLAIGLAFFSLGHLLP